MPPLVAVAAAAAAAGAASAATAAAITAGLVVAGSVGAAVIGGLAAGFVGLAVTFVGNSLLGSNQIRSQTPVVTGRNLTVRQPVMPRITCFGYQRLGGALTFIALEGNGHESRMHVVLTLSGHQVARIGEGYIDGVPLGLDAGGNSVRGKYANLVQVEKKLGAPGEPAFPKLIAANVGWTSAHRQDGCASVHLLLIYDRTVMAGFDVSRLAFDVFGYCQIYDPRTDTAGFNDNAALVNAGYVTNDDFGLNSDQTEDVNSDDLIASANSSDEYVTLAPASASFTADPAAPVIGPPFDGQTITLTEPMQPVSGGTASGLWAPLLGDKVQVAAANATLATPLAPGFTYYAIPTPDGLGIQLATSQADALAGVPITLSGSPSGTAVLQPFGYSLGWNVGASQLVLPAGAPPIEVATAVTLADSGVLPAGLAAGTDYFIIPGSSQMGDLSASPPTPCTFTLQLASSLANALAFTAVTFGDAGSGAMILTRTAERRYTANGAFAVDQTPSSIITALTAAMGGTAGRDIWTGGQWSIRAGVYSAPTVSLSEDDFRKDGFSVSPQVGRRDYFNGVRGTFINPALDWQQDDYPPQSVDAYVSADGGRAFKQLQLSFTISGSMAQRIAQLELQRGRIELQIAQLPCKLSALQLRAGETVQLSYSRFGWVDQIFEVAAQGFVIELDANNTPILGVDLGLRAVSADAYAWDPAGAKPISIRPISLLPNPSNISAPTGFTLATNAGSLILSQDGTATVQVEATWDPVTDPYVTTFELQWQKLGDLTWQQSVVSGVGVASAFFGPLNANTNYLVRLRSINGVGAASAWATAIFSPDYGGLPGSATVFAFIEPPALLSATGYELRIPLYGGENWGGAYLEWGTDGQNFTALGVQQGPANCGVLAAPMNGFYSFLPDEAVVDLSLSGGALRGHSISDALNFVSAAMIDDELVAFSQVFPTGANYGLELDVRQGAGSPLEAHAIGAPFTALDEQCFKLDYDPGLVGRALYFRIRSFNKRGAALQTTDEAIIVSHVLTGPPAPPAPQDLRFSISAKGIQFDWDAVPGANIAGYIVVDTDIGPVTPSPFGSTSFLYAYTAAGFKSFRVYAVDRAGRNSNPPASVGVLIDPPGTPTPTARFVDENIEISIAAGTTGSFPLASYTVAGDFGDGNVDIRSAKFTEKVSWIGPATFTVVANDSVGNPSAAGTCTATVVAPSVTGLAAQVIANQVALTAALDPESLPIEYVSIREGASLGGAVEIGRMGAGSDFAVIQETDAGTYIFWAVPVDSAGNEGTAAETPAVVSAPPGFVQRNKWISTFGGTLTNALVDGDGGLLVPVDTTATFSSRFTARGWSSFQDQINAGYPHIMQPTLSTASYVEIFDEGTTIPPTQITDAVKLDDIVAGVTLTDTIEVATSLGGPWTSNGGGLSFFSPISFRYHRHTLSFASADDHYLAEIPKGQFTVTLSAQLVDDVVAGTASSSDASPGTHFNTNLAFASIASVTATAVGTTTPLIAVITVDAGANPAGFSIMWFDRATGARVTTDFTAPIKGYLVG